MTTSKNITSYIKALIASIFLLTALPSFASYSPMSHTFFGAGNECAGSGYFTPPSENGFSACTIFMKDSQDNPIEDSDGNIISYSDVLAKYDVDEDEYSVNSNYITKTEAEVKLNISGDDQGGLDQKSGTWSYNGDSPGIKFWIAKSAVNFTLFWMVDLNTANGACDGIIKFTAACLNLAQTVTSGVWSTPETTRTNKKMITTTKQQGLSHITLFGGEKTTTKVPEPNTVFLFALALLALVIKQKHLRLFKS